MVEDTLNSERIASWQTSAPISLERAQELQTRLHVAADPMKSVFPFKDVTLTRADIEWLLLRHDGGKGPVDWSDAAQRNRQGLDLRGARLSGEDLSGLPLARLIGGLTTEERLLASKEAAREKELRDAAGVHMEGVNLTDTHLEGAILRSARLEGACLFRTRLEHANLTMAHMEGSDCRAAHFEGASMATVHLGGFSADTPPHPQHWVADFSGPVVDVRQTAFPTTLPPASLRLAFFDVATSFYPDIGNERLGFISIVDARLNDMNLARVDWTKVSILGDERTARNKYTRFGKARTLSGRIALYKVAARANSQLAIALSAQGMADQATRFLYRSLILDRKLMALRIRKGQLKHLVPYLLSWFLFLVTGYGYRMWRLLLTYVLLIAGFAAGYALTGKYCGVTLGLSSGMWLSCRPDISWFNVLLISLTAFHGRVFSQQFGVGSPQFVLTAVEAIVGLVVESIFIAMLTQRVFNR